MFTLISLFAAAVAMASGVFFIQQGRKGRTADQEFVRAGVHAQARVLELRPRSHPYNQDTTDQPAWFPYVELELPDGRLILAESKNGARPAPARVGDLVPIVYDPAQPERLMVTKGLAQPGLVGGFHIAVGCCLIVVGVLALGLWALLKLVLDVPI